MPTAVRTKKFIPKPAAPEIDPRFQTVKAKVGQKAAQIKKHPPAKLKAEEAAKAAKAPPNEKQAGAKEKQTDLMKAAKAEKVEPDNFRVLLRAEISKVMPETLDDADSFMEDGKQEQMKGAVSGKVSEQKNTAESQIKTTAKQKPNTTGVPIKEVKDLPETPPTPVPTVNAAEAMPIPRTEAEISQKQSKSDADQQFKDAQITTKQLKKADDPHFTAALDAKKEVETVADASPAKYRAGEKFLIGQTAAKAQSDGRRNLFALAGVKIKSGAAVKSRQLAAKAKDEQARKQVADNIETMYNTTKMLVEMRLSTLEITVFSMFDSGSAAAIAAMKADTTREIDVYKDDRYSGIRGKARWIADLFRATPKGIVKIIEKNLQVFKAAMDTLIDRVAATVETRLQQAKDEIDRGQTRIKNYVSTLKGSLKDVGKAAEKEVAGRFDEMRAGVEDRKNALAQKLAESYKSAIDKGNALASEMEAENAGAAYRLAKKIAEIAQLILDFKDKLVAVLKKAVSVILDILADPIGFFGNLIDALRQGFSQFTTNFASNFKEAIAKWLFGNLGGEGFALPKDLSAPSILKLVMGVAGLTYDKIRGKAVKLIGERNVALLEKLYEYLKVLFTGGADALWTEVKKDFGNLQETIIGGIKSWLMTTLVEAGIKKLLTMFVPGGGFVQAALAIYKIVVFIVERAAQIAEFIGSIVDSVADIVSGSISAAASRIEKSLIQALALIIDLLARLVGVSGIAQTIKSLIKKVQDKVEKAIDFVIAKVVQTVRQLFGKKTGKAEVPKTQDGKVDQSEQVKTEAGEELSSRIKGNIISYEEISGILGFVVAKLKPKGLKSLGLVAGKKPTNAFTILAEASLATKVAKFLAKITGPKEDQIELRLGAFSTKTTIFASAASVRSQTFESKGMKGASVHAESFFIGKLPDLVKEHIEKSTKKTKGSITTSVNNTDNSNLPPIVFTLQINRTPCGDCAKNLIKAQHTTYHGRKISLVIQASSLYVKSEFQTKIDPEGKKEVVRVPVVQSKMDNLEAMHNAGIKLEVWDIWKEIQANSSDPVVSKLSQEIIKENVEETNRLEKWLNGLKRKIEQQKAMFGLKK